MLSNYIVSLTMKFPVLLLFIHLHPLFTFDFWSIRGVSHGLHPDQKMLFQSNSQGKKNQHVQGRPGSRDLWIYRYKPISALCLACCNFATAASHTSAQTFQFPAQWIAVIGKSTLAMCQIQQTMHLGPLICAFSILHLTRSLKVKQRRLGGCKCAPHADMYLHNNYTCR